MPWGSKGLAMSVCWVSALIHSNTFMRRGDIWLLVDGPTVCRQQHVPLECRVSPLLLGVAEGGLAFLRSYYLTQTS